MILYTDSSSTAHIHRIQFEKIKSLIMYPNTASTTGGFTTYYIHNLNKNYDMFKYNTEKPPLRVA